MVPPFPNVLPGHNPEKKLKAGRYHGSVYENIKGFSINRWVFGAIIEVDIQKYAEEGLSAEETLSECIDFLNQPPPRKKFQRKINKPLFGSLEVYEYKIVDNSFQVLLITDKRTNKLIWGEGLVPAMAKIGRSKKKKR